MHCSSLKSIAAAVLLSSLAAPHATWAEQGRVDVRDTVTSAVPATQREAIASASLRTLRYITRARNAIHKDDPDQARRDIQQARELLALVDAVRPAARLKEHVWVARQHMDYETAQEVIDDLTLINAELSSLGDIMSTAEARRHLKSAQALLMQDDTRAARQELDRLEASLIFTEFDLPLAASEQQLLAAQEALNRNQPATADKHLVSAEESIQFVTLGATAPLAGARTHLRRAAAHYRDEYYAAARADLAQASEWLRRSADGADARHRKDAQQLAADIDALKKKLDRRTDDHTHTLSGFLHRNLVLIEREAEELWLRYKRQQAANHTLRKLLDAKTQLSYAGHDLARGRKPDTITGNLASADRDLADALRQARPPVREQIEQLRREIQSLESGLGGDREKATRQYEQALADLVRLIHEQ